MNKLKEFRIKSDLSQQYVADYLKISQSQYSYHENGRSLLNAKQILELCTLFRCSPNDLLGFKGVHTVVAGRLDEEI